MGAWVPIYNDEISQVRVLGMWKLLMQIVDFGFSCGSQICLS